MFQRRIGAKDFYIMLIKVGHNDVRRGNIVGLSRLLARKRRLFTKNWTSTVTVHQLKTSTAVRLHQIVNLKNKTKVSHAY